ncbi:MAG TPA: indole-3-glycerol phosphate synthase TrpC [Thermoleophilaceae bacterium]|nr:indole-3-glycerol phosphate synthase TrpC [Thermoleophilaceae bacterium]
MSVRLEPILEATRQRIERCRRELPEDELAGRIELGREGRPFSEALSHPGTSVIAEHKRRSPSAGTLREGASVRDVTIAYERGGAAALSILTEEEHFGGSLDDLREAISVTDLPVLRKDFTIDRYQLLEAKAAGADAVLLVVGALEPEQLADLYAEARELDLDAFVEVHDRRELEAALEIDADVVGINNRDLTDFTVDVLRTFDLLADVPAGKTVVSESGIAERAQIEELELVGIDAVLVGETLMRAADPEAAVRELTRTEEPTQG